MGLFEFTFAMSELFREPGDLEEGGRVSVKDISQTESKGEWPYLRFLLFEAFCNSRINRLRVGSKTSGDCIIRDRVSTVTVAR